MKEEPYTYDMTFCVSQCKNKCYRHVDNYIFDSRDIWIADFKCEEKNNDRPRKVIR